MPDAGAAGPKLPQRKAQAERPDPRQRGPLRSQQQRINPGLFRRGPRRPVPLRPHRIDILTKSISRADAKAYINVYIWNSLRKEYYASGSFAVDHYSDLKTAFVSSFNVAPQLILVTYFEDVLGSANIVLQSITCSNYQCTVNKPMSIP